MAHRNGDNLPKQQGNLAIKRKASSLPKTILNLGILGAVLCVLLWWGHHWDYLPQQSWKSWDASDSSAWSVWRSRWILPVLQPALNILVWMFVLLVRLSFTLRNVRPKKIAKLPLIAF